MYASFLSVLMGDGASEQAENLHDESKRNMEII